MMTFLASFLSSLTNDVRDGGFWLPPQASTAAPGVDQLFDFILWVSVFFFLLIVGLMVFFVVRFRRRAPDGEAQPSPAHNTPLEVTWTLIPLAIVVVIFAWGFKLFLDLSTPPRNAYEIQVTAQKWKWLFTYPSGHVDENLHVPGDRPVKLVMTSEDVIHSFFVPAFRVKRDVVPGRYSTAWFRPTRTGEFQLYCTEYCGTQHSDMLAKVVVHEAGGFERWLEDASNILARLSPAEAGEQLYRVRGCTQCHSVDGGAKIGPSFRAAFGATRTMRSGESLVVDENYIRQSILEPQALVLAGYEPVMPTYKGRISDQEITAIIAYLKALEE